VRATKVADADVKTDNRSRFQRLNPWWIAAGVCVVVLVLWMLLPWEWSTIDEPGHVLALRQYVEQQGIVGGVWQSAWDQFQGALSGGVFKPAHWVYSSILYILPISVAHGIRFLMLATAMAGPLVYLHRRGSTKPNMAFSVLLLVAGCSALYVGLTFMSLQELSGAAFIGLGLMFHRTLPRILLWTIAACFKSPFAWLLIGYSVPLWRRGQRRMSIASLLTGLTALTLATLMARNGYYTTQVFRSTAGLINDSLLGNGPKLFEWPALLILGSFLWWWVFTRTRLRFDAEALAFAIGLIGYSATLLLWSISGYYMGPVLYLLAICLLSLLGKLRILPLWRLALALAVPLLVAGWVLAGALATGVKTNLALSGTRDCLLQIHPAPHVLSSGNLIYLDTPEAADRFTQIMELRDPGWQGTIEYTDPNTEPASQSWTHYLWIGSGRPAGTQIGPVVCQTGAVSIYSRNP
jgi:hypothetical protein